MYSLILHGKRCIDLHTLRVLSVKLLQNASAFSNSFSSATASTSDLVHQKGKIFTVPESLELTTKPAESISSEKNSDSVLKLLRSYGFTDSQISGIISTYPGLLTLDAEKTLLPKLQALQSRGASSSELTEIVSKVPKILGKSGEKSIGLYYDFVKDIIHNNEEEEEESSKCEKLCDSSPKGRQGNKIRNISVLRELGVPQRSLLRLLMSKSQPVWGKEKFEESVKKVVEMGFGPASSNFVLALHVVYDMSEKTIEDKVNVYKKLGFAVEDVWEIFKKWPYALKFSEKKITWSFEALKKCGLVEEEVMSVIKKRPQLMRGSEEKMRNCVETFLKLGFSRDEFVVMIKCFPSCIGLSAETVTKKVEFLVKKMNWPLKEVVVMPPVLGYSLEKRIVPRCNVIRALLSKGLMKGGNGIPPPMSSVLANNQAFLNRFVLKHDKLVPELMAIFTAVQKPNENGVCISKGGRFSLNESEGKPPKSADLDLNLCKVFHGETCCSASKMQTVSLAVENLATYGEAVKDCLDLFELLECSICHQNVGTESGPLRIYYFTSNVSNQVIVPCGANEGIICGKASKWESNGKAFCDAAGFIVQTDGDSVEEPS